MKHINAVATELGTTPAVLRIWEARYPNYHPARDEEGCRVYSEELVETLSIIIRLNSIGYRLKSLFERSYEDLIRMRDKTSEVTPGRPKRAPAAVRLPIKPKLIELLKDIYENNQKSPEMGRDLDSRLLDSRIAEAIYILENKGIS